MINMAILAQRFKDTSRIMLVSSVQHPRQKRKRREKFDCEREREEEENFQLSSVHL